MTSHELVSVIIPAFNAQATLDETLRSVRGQTHKHLEILVVDDGSKDGTPAIVEQHAALDTRIRLIRQENAGVAAARNEGSRQARGNLLAFVDADDLWAAEKIEKQLAVLLVAGEGVGLVYTWYARIDGQSRIIDTAYRPTDCGNVIERLCLGNLVGNGSAILVKRAAMVAAGGFDPSLRAQNAQGCEDWLFYFRVAERYSFAVVREPLTGYRELPDAMSADVGRMLRSADLVADHMLRRRPEFRKAIARGNADYRGWLLMRAIKQSQWSDAALLAGQILAREPARLFPVGVRLLHVLKNKWRAAADLSVPTRQFPVPDPVSVP